MTSGSRRESNLIRAIHLQYASQASEIGLPKIINQIKQFLHQTHINNPANVTEEVAKLMALLWLMVNDDSRSPLSRSERQRRFALCLAKLGNDKSYTPEKARTLLARFPLTIQYEFPDIPILRTINSQVLHQHFYEIMVRPLFEAYLNYLGEKHCQHLLQAIEKKQLQMPCSEYENQLIARFKLNSKNPTHVKRVHEFHQKAASHFTYDRYYRENNIRTVATENEISGYHFVNKLLCTNLWGFYNDELKKVLKSRLEKGLNQPAQKTHSALAG